MNEGGSFCGRHSPQCAYVFWQALQIPSEYLFKNLTTFASVSPVWTRGTTLEEEETQRHTVVRGSARSGPGAASRAGTSLPLQPDRASSPVCAQTF